MKDRMKVGGNKGKKMKKKTLVLIGIAICVILLTSPVLASGGYSKIYGNANEDDVLDMRDVTYIKLVIFGKKPATTFADANNDGKISMLDIGQTKLIILRKEKELTFIDMADRIVTINKPIERVALADLQDGINTLVQLGAEDKIVGITEGIKKQGYGQLINPEPSSWWTPLQVVAPGLKDLPTVGTWNDPNLESILSLEPDVVFAYCARDLGTGNTIQDKTGIPTVCLTNLGGSSFAKLDNLEIYRLIGEIVGKEERGEELISYTNEKVEEITDVTSEIPDSERPRVYMAAWMVYLTKTPLHYDPIDVAGGMNVAKGSEADFIMVEVSKEQIIAWNPDIILIHRVPTSKSHVWGNKREDILTDPDLQTVKAVKNERVYYTKGFCAGWDPATGVAETLYLAKLFHPNKFEDVDVAEDCNKILERFYGVDGLYTEMAERCEFYQWE